MNINIQQFYVKSNYKSMGTVAMAIHFDEFNPLLTDGYMVTFTTRS